MEAGESGSGDDDSPWVRFWSGDIVFVRLVTAYGVVMCWSDGPEMFSGARQEDLESSHSSECCYRLPLASGMARSESDREDQSRARTHSSLDREGRRRSITRSDSDRKDRRHIFETLLRKENLTPLLRREIQDANALSESSGDDASPPSIPGFRVTLVAP